MSNKDDGGPAFPSHGSIGEVVHEGMSMRDYAAIKFAASFCMPPDGGLSPTSVDADWKAATARVAYELADAMIVARTA